MILCTKQRTFTKSQPLCKVLHIGCSTVRNPMSEEHSSLPLNYGRPHHLLAHPHPNRHSPASSFVRECVLQNIKVLRIPVIGIKVIETKFNGKEIKIKSKYPSIWLFLNKQVLAVVFQTYCTALRKDLIAHVCLLIIFHSENS